MKASDARAMTVDQLDEAQVSVTFSKGWDALGKTDQLVQLQQQAYRARGFGDFWQHMLVAEGAVDLAIVTAFEPATRAAFMDAYGGDQAVSWRHARMIGVLFGAALLAADPGGVVGEASKRWLERLAAEA